MKLYDFKYNTRKYHYMCMGKAIGENFEQTKTN